MTGVRRVVVADRDASVRQDLSAVLRRAEGCEVVGEAGDAESLVALLDEQRPDVAIVDLELPRVGGPEALADSLRDVVPDLKVIVLSDDTPDAVVVQTLVSGVDGFIVKESARQMLPTAVGAVARGGTFVDPTVAGVLTTTLFGRPSDRDDGSKGTTRP